MKGGNRQASESFRLSAILSFSGGLQDAYTYNVRDRVFANAQTGNVVLMSQNFMQGRMLQGLRYLFPLLCFALGILAAERIGFRFRDAKRLHWRQIILLLEILLLGIVGFIPDSYHMAANMLVSLSCAMQVQAFRTVHGYGYASTMCIGNLRSGTESLSQYLRSRDPEAGNKVLHYYGIILVFALGAGTGGVLSGLFGIRTVWICVALLAGCFFLMYHYSEPKEPLRDNVTVHS